MTSNDLRKITTKLQVSPTAPLECLRHNKQCVLWFLTARGKFDCVCENTYMGHGSTDTDPWPMWPIQKSDPFDPLIHDPSTHCLLWWGSSSPRKKDTAPNFRPMSIVAKRSPISATAEHLFTFCFVFPIFVTGGDFKFGTQVDHNAGWQSTPERVVVILIWNFCGQSYFWTAKARDVKFCIRL